MRPTDGSTKLPHSEDAGECAELQALINRLNEDNVSASIADAMGIYPTFIKGVYETDYSEWEFYFSPRENVNIDEDHSYDAPGEYRVEIQSLSGEVTMCNWYIDEFWPDYALRTWNTGRCDYVWAEACRGGAFYKQPLESQEMFRELL